MSLREMLPSRGEAVKKDLPNGLAQQLARISHTFEGRNEQTQTLPELRSLHYGCSREHGINREDCVCAVPAKLCDLVPAYCEKCELGSWRW